MKVEDDTHNRKLTIRRERVPLVSSPRRGEVRGSGMRGRRQRYAESLPPHLPLRGIFSPAGRRNTRHRFTYRKEAFHASSHFTCSAVSTISSAERLSSSSAMVRGPISGMTGKGWAMT